MFEEEVKSKHKSPLQKLPTKKEPTMNASHQISCILKVFYNDIGVYFNVCTKIIYICIHMYIVHIMNLKINI